MQTIGSLVAAGLGVALVPAPLAGLHLDGLIFRPLVEVEVRAETVPIETVSPPRDFTAA